MSWRRNSAWTARCCSRIRDLKIAAKSHASVLSKDQRREKIRRWPRETLALKAATGMDAEAAAKTQAERLPPTKRRPKRSVVSRCRARA